MIHQPRWSNNANNVELGRRIGYAAGLVCVTFPTDVRRPVNRPNCQKLSGDVFWNRQTDIIYSSPSGFSLDLSDLGEKWPEI